VPPGAAGNRCTSFDVAQGCSSTSVCAAACSSGAGCNPITAGWDNSGWC
jgi:hypothetical protein